MFVANQYIFMWILFVNFVSESAYEVHVFKQKKQEIYMQRKFQAPSDFSILDP
jgi:hypothetical protein